jgi:hypothetical protein
VSKDAADIPGLLVGEVGIKDYGEKGENVVVFQQNLRKDLLNNISFQFVELLKIKFHVVFFLD